MTFGTQFLSDPVWLPNPAGSEPWGEECVDLEIAGTRTSITGLSAMQAATVRNRFHAWLSDRGARGRETIPVAIRRIDDAAFRTLDRRGWSYSFDRRYRADAVWLAGPDFIACFAPTSAPGGTQWLRETGNDSFLTPLENFLRVLMAYRLMHRGGVLFHSCGVVVDEGVHLFFGRSGAGKSTMGRRALAAGHRILSDDINAVDRRRGMLCATAVPFAGELAAQSPGGGWLPVTRLIQLCKSGRLSAHRLSSGAAVAALAVCSPVVNDDPERSNLLMDNLADIAVTIPVQRLECPRETHFADITAIIQGPVKNTAAL